MSAAGLLSCLEGAAACWRDDDCGATCSSAAESWARGSLVRSCAVLTDRICSCCRVFGLESSDCGLEI